LNLAEALVGLGQAEEAATAARPAWHSCSAIRVYQSKTYLSPIVFGTKIVGRWAHRPQALFRFFSRFGMKAAVLFPTGRSVVLSANLTVGEQSN